MLTGKGVNPQAADLDAARPNYGVYWNFLSAGFTMGLQSGNSTRSTTDGSLQDGGMLPNNYHV